MHSPLAPPAPGDGYVQSFARGLAVIRSFGEHAPSQTLTEVAAATGLSRAGARRILLTLQALGYVQQDGRRFALSPRILELGFAYLSSQPLWQRAEPVMQALVEAVHESCSAAVLDGSEVVYVLRVPARKIIGINLGVGSRLPAHCTAMGRVLLAALPPAQRAALLAQPLPARTRHTITNPLELARVLDEVAAQDHCIVDQELEEGLVTLAVPLRERSGRVVAALNISGQSSRTPPALLHEALLPQLRAAASQISALL